MTRHVTFMTIDDAEHYTPERREEIVAAYPAHEREARAKGIPVLGGGRIFPVEEAKIAIKPFQPPAYWPRLGSMDFGYDHPFAAVENVYDPEGDVIYVVKTHREREASPVTLAAALKPWGNWLPWAWPHDGNNQTLAGAGKPLAKQFEEHGLNMLGERATFPDGSDSVEAGLMEMLDRMLTGRYRVFDHLNDWFEEFRLYHRKDGKVVKIRDDLMSASRYGVMMIRHALLTPALRSENRKKAAARNPLGADPLESF
jgi:hypothetical protein